MITSRTNTVRPGRSSGGSTCQRGLAPATELVIILPALIILLGVIIGGARIWFARSVVTDAAYSGARAASLERDPRSAGTAGRDATGQRLAMRGITCVQTSVDLDVSGFGQPVGRPASVTERIRCQVDLGNLLVPGLPGSMTITGQGSSPIDSYRER
ncbi:membrane protein [Microlunatus endophyticus]|uniref:Membrane protein n=1 Tax=Microlunatus endophyticus TaxID=1716077 RepID=A0A917SD13_9ACTN|nr:TadE/TadG family type IV pilus assembly protein [Microlunatus endophyticus]GGL71295.1 membrane protein [Microlunatus endophyticus]